MSCHFDVAECRDCMELFMGDRIHREMARETLTAFVDQLIEDIDMVKYGEPLIKHFGSGDAAGWSIVQLIETSNITMHTCDESRDMYIDVFSCKRFDCERVKRFIEVVFSPRSVKYINLGRQAEKSI